MNHPWTRFYPDGVDADCRPSAATLVDLLEGAVARDPRAPALVYQGRVTTYEELWSLSLAAADLVERGGGRLVLALPNVPAFAAMFFGALYAGRAVVPVNGQLTAAELDAVLTDTEPDILVVPPELEPTYRQVLSRWTGLP